MQHASACVQVTEQRETLARYETLDNGKPISESLWDIVSDRLFRRRRMLLLPAVLCVLKPGHSCNWSRGVL
jgi:hypothetical protein